MTTPEVEPIIFLVRGKSSLPCFPGFYLYQLMLSSKRNIYITFGSGYRKKLAATFEEFLLYVSCPD